MSGATPLQSVHGYTIYLLDMHIDRRFIDARGIDVYAGRALDLAARRGSALAHIRAGFDSRRLVVLAGTPWQKRTPPCRRTSKSSTRYA